MSRITIASDAAESANNGLWSRAYVDFSRGTVDLSRTMIIGDRERGSRKYCSGVAGVVVNGRRRLY